MLDTIHTKEHSLRLVEHGLFGGPQRDQLKLKMMTSDGLKPFTTIESYMHKH